MSLEQQKYENIISSLSASTVSQIDGVADLSLDSGATFSGKLFRSTSNCVQVTIVEKSAIIDISIKAYYGYKVPELAYTIQRAVKQKVETATPYRVKSVNVNVVGVVLK